MTDIPAPSRDGSRCPTIQNEVRLGRRALRANPSPGGGPRRAVWTNLREPKEYGLRPIPPRGPLSLRRTTRSAGGPLGPQRVSILPGRSRRPSLLATFAIVSLIPLTALGFGLFYFLEGQIRSRALDGARNAATLVARSSVETIVCR